MEGIRRFDHVSYGMVSDPNGEYIFHSDHEAEVARLHAEVEKVRGYDVAPLEAKVAELRAEVEAYRKDAKRWRFFQTAGYNVTLRMHYTRPDEREKAIDAAMGASA